ncbi:zinc metalloproteinase-disintegrin-like batroxstatin-3 [Argiope bruennichi]|uniref:zinc metalloproteinase-disintegrin-like batroxstatin-3 n=1 Tax=Argiope bruennichi TaxID=94029 RepID=UPI0024952376|nr:zinc metalloproteinase-disintegrin-like batroxstatin-3 [Argiope bruennichi]
MHWKLGCHNMYFLLFFIVLDKCLAGPGDAGLRVLLQNPYNQELITHLGTRYEIVNPIQIRQEWGRRLSTRATTVNGTVTHLPHTSLFIETYEHKLHLDLVLNKNLFPQTLVQFIYEKGGPPLALQEIPENCYYHATIRNFPDASAAFSTCNGIKGIILLENKVFLLQPLQGNHSDNHPHLLYHITTDQFLNCATTKDADNPHENMFRFIPKENILQRNKFIEIAVVIDQILFERYNLHPTEVITSTIEMVNYADLFYRPLSTSISVVFIEIWIDDQMIIDADISKSLKDFEEYSDRRIKRISVDAAHLLSGLHFKASRKGLANVDTICTAKAVGITSVTDVYQFHITALILAHLIGHNLGMVHDHADCACSNNKQCIMSNNIPYFQSTVFSNCSIQKYYETLDKGYGACLFNRPSMRMSICGNSIVEESEECDCGPPEECAKHNPCCNPVTCKLIKHAECSTGVCCKKCKLLSSDFLCRPSKGECDIPEFCNGIEGECPPDLFKKNGAICSGGLGYCFQGDCPLLKRQCQDIWGESAESANAACYEKLNVLGTPNGNCGFDNRGEIQKCTIEDSYCGSLQCSEGEKTPIAKEVLPIDFVVYKMNAEGSVHECKTRTFSSFDLMHGLVKDGTKCGFQKMCLNQTCSSIRNIITGKCPLEEFQATCSGHGTCTNINTCYCEEGWKGYDCSTVDEESLRGSTKSNTDYYDSTGESLLENSQYGENELQLNPNLAITVLAGCVIIGLLLVVVAVMFIFYRNLWTTKSSTTRR